MKEITISIPAYNDENSIKNLIEEIFSIESFLPPFKILIINDGSTDNTLKNITELNQKYPNILVHNHTKNLGFGKTIAEVVKLPDTEWIAFLSGDHQFSALNLLKLLKEKENADFILGVRKIRMDNFIRKVNSKIYNFILELYTGFKIKDVNSIFLCKSSLFKEIELRSDSAFIHAEIFLHALKNPSKVKFINIEHKPRKQGKGSGGKLRIILPTIKDFLRYTFKCL